MFIWSVILEARRPRAQCQHLARAFDLMVEKQKDIARVCGRAGFRNSHGNLPIPLRMALVHW